MQKKFECIEAVVMTLPLLNVWTAAERVGLGSICCNFF